MTWQDLLAALQLEIQQHTLSTFHDEPGERRGDDGLSEVSEKIPDNSAIL